jgi:protocatechuate 3,4-dioxygenase beta subunit
MMTLKAEKPKSPTTMSKSTIVMITLLSLITLLLTYTSFVNLPKSSFAQTINTNQTPSSSASPPTQQECATTEATNQGPEYKAGSPFRQGKDFAKGLQGPRLELSGKVLNMACKPVQGAVLDIWQADSNGTYDNKGFDLRGKITTDKDGKYVLDTIYPGRLHIGATVIRPSHIHVMVGIPGQPMLTTQVYLEGQPRDAAVKDSLITKPVIDANGTKIANFDFVVEDYRGLQLNKLLA